MRPLTENHKDEIVECSVFSDFRKKELSVHLVVRIWQAGVSREWSGCQVTQMCTFSQLNLFYQFIRLLHFKHVDHSDLNLTSQVAITRSAAADGPPQCVCIVCKMARTKLKAQEMHNQKLGEPKGRPRLEYPPDEPPDPVVRCEPTKQRFYGKKGEEMENCTFLKSPNVPISKFFW